MKSKKTSKIIKIIVFIVLLIIIAITTLLGVYFYLKNKNNLKENPAVYYAIFDDGTYYIPKAEPNIKFAIDTNDTNSYKLTNSNNETVESKIVEQKGKKYIQANKKYTEGETYQLELDTANFDDENLKETKKVQFKIKEKQKSEYEISKNAITVNKEDITQEDETKIKLNNKDIKEGKTILVKDGDNINNAYKISNINGDEATIEAPNISEIYENVDLYKEGKINFNDLKVKENAEIEIEKSIKKSALYKFLSTEVYAAQGDTKISLETDGDKVKIEIELSFKADGEKKLGLDSLKQHDLSIKLSYEISTEYIVDVKKDFSINYDMAVKTTSEIQIELKSGNAYLKGISNISDEEYSKSIQEIVQKLQNEVPDVSENSIDIGAIEVPTGIPGINVYFDIYFQTQLSLQINLTYQGKFETVQHAGFIMNKNEKRAYQNTSQSTSSHEITALGKAEIKIGIGLDGGVSIINKDIAHAGIGVELGAYNEYFATAKLEFSTNKQDNDSGITAKIELGIYLQVKFDCSVDVVFFKADYSANLAEVKQPVLKLETGVDWSDNNTATDNTKTETPSSSNQTPSTSSSSNKTTGTETGTVGSLSINTDSEPIKAYKKYITSKQYIEDYKKYYQESQISDKQLNNVGYCIFDLNKDGIPELIISSQLEIAWNVDTIYTYNTSNKTVEKIDMIYNYGGIRYEKNEKEIVYSEIRPNIITGSSGFYKLQNNKLVLEKVVWHDRGYDDSTTNQYVDNAGVRYANGKEIKITEEQERAYYNNVIYFSYQDINNVK